MSLDRERTDIAISVHQPEDREIDGFPALEGVTIEKIFRNIEAVAELHTVLSSPRGQYLHRRLLHSLRKGLTLDEIERLRKQFGVEESERHINKLTKWGLTEPVASPEGITGHVRTALGEEALNAVRELERKIGEDRARLICEAGLGSNAIKLFLTIFGNKKELKLSSREIIYTPLEIGQLMRLFARSVEGISSMDKLYDAGLVSYLDDGNIHVNPRRSTAFYAYLKKLYQLLLKPRSLANRAELSESGNGEPAG